MTTHDFNYYSKPKKWRNFGIILVIILIAFFIYNSLEFSTVDNSENSIEELTIPIPSTPLTLESPQTTP